MASQRVGRDADLDQLGHRWRGVVATLCVIVEQQQPELEVVDRRLIGEAMVSRHQVDPAQWRIYD